MLDASLTRPVRASSNFEKAALRRTRSEGGTDHVLDACNGRVGPDGTYRYHATSAFPYIVGCQVGTPTKQTGSAAAPMPPMGNGNRPPPPPGR